MTSSLIFITGATGFIGSEVLRQTLAAGHRARLSVRKESQVQEMKDRFPATAGSLDFVVIPDLSDPGSYAGALAGVDYVFHIASPMPGHGDDFRSEYLEPAVRGTEALLDAALKVPTIKKFIVTSSILGLLPMDWATQPGRGPVDEDSDEPITVDPNYVFPEGQAGYTQKYQASKILAHVATGDWAAKHKPNFQLVTFHPSFVIGHDLAQTGAEPRGPNSVLLLSLASQEPIIPSCFVHVLDVAEAYLRAVDAAFDKQPATVLLTGKPVSWDDISAFVKDKYPAIPVKLEGPLPAPVLPETRRAEKLLGIKWRDPLEAVGAVIEQQASQRKQ